MFRKYDFGDYKTKLAVFGFFVMVLFGKLPWAVRKRWPFWQVYQWSFDVQRRGEKTFEERLDSAESPEEKLGMLLGRALAKAHIKAVEQSDDTFEIGEYESNK